MTEPASDEPVVLEAPADGVPEVIDTPDALRAAVAALEAGSGPVALDTERAQGFRYSGRAYLIQVRRAGAGTVLLDPIPFADGDTPADLLMARRAGCARAIAVRTGATPLHRVADLADHVLPSVQEIETVLD